MPGTVALSTLFLDIVSWAAFIVCALRTEQPLALAPEATPEATMNHGTNMACLVSRGEMGQADI